MAQVNWTYLDNIGGQHRVGLYHGDRTGHVAIFCNLKLVQVDFSVKETAYYSFFIEDELCEIHLVKEKNGFFGYEFKVNKQVDTPLNQQRRKILRMERWQFAAGIGVMILFLAGLLFFNRYQKSKRVYEAMSERSIIGNLSPEQVVQLQERGEPAMATFFVLETQGQVKAYYTIVTADSNRITGTIKPNQSGQVVLPNGFTIADRDRFKAQYLPENPYVHRVNFYDPDPSTVQSYLQNAIKIEQLLHPERSPEQSKCLIESVMRTKNWTSLAVILHQNEQQKTNRNAYMRLVRDEDVMRTVRQRCKQ